MKEQADIVNHYTFNIMGNKLLRKNKHMHEEKKYYTDYFKFFRKQYFHISKIYFELIWYY